MNDKRKSVYVNKHDHETYSLTIETKLNANGLPQKLYRLRNQIHFWEGTKEQFENEFERL
jgi:hypothetical protein